jgi:heptosyltransferase-2
MAQQRIVVRLPNWLGDIVMATPALVAIRRHFAGATLAVAAPAGFAGLCRAMAGVDEVVPLEGRGVRALGAHAAALRDGRFDLAILLTNSFVTALATHRAGIPERWGVRRDFRGPLLTRGVKRPRPAERHHSLYYAALVQALGIAAAPEHLLLRTDATARDAARALLEARGWNGTAPLVALAPGAAYGGAKRWPAEHAAATIAALDARGVRTVLVGAGADRDAARAVESAVAAGGGRTAPLNVVGDTDLGRLMALFEECRLVIANDSGAMHVASAVGRPVVAVFGPTDELATAPLGPHTIVRHAVWCRPCLLRECPLDHGCMRGVSGDAVVRAALPWLELDGHARS